LLETGVTLVVNPTVAEDKEWKKLEDNWVLKKKCDLQRFQNS
jgi:hypothetical protein